MDNLDDDSDGETNAFMEDSIEWKEESQNEIAIRDDKECTDVARKTGDKHAEMKANLLVAEENQVLKHYDEAIQYAVRSADIAKETGDKHSEMKACLVLGKAHQALQQYDEAIKYVKTSLDIAKEIGDEHTEIRACALQQYDKLSQDISVFLISSRLFVMMQDDEANQYAKICFGILNKETDSWMMVKTLSVALAKFNFSAHDDAIKYARKCLEISSGDESKEFEKEVYLLLAKSHKSLNQYEDAILYFEVARGIAEQNKDKDIEMMACASICKIYGKLNQCEETIKYAKMWLDIAKETQGSQEKLMEAYSFLWSAHFLSDQYDSALTYCKEYLDLAKQVGNKNSEMTVCLVIGCICNQLHQYSEAVSHFKRAMDIANQTGDKHTEEMACLNIGEAYLNLEQYSDAIQYANIYLNMENKTDSDKLESTAYSLLFEAYKQLGQYEDASSCFLKVFELDQKKEDQDDKPHVELPDKHKEAVIYWKRCPDIAIEVDDKEKLLMPYLRLGETYFNSYQYDHSSFYYKKTAGIASETGNKDIEMTVCLQLAQIDLLLNQNQEGMLYAKKALEIAKELGHKKAEMRAYSLLLRLSYSADNCDFLSYASKYTAITKEAGDPHEEVLGSIMELKISSNKTEKHEHFFDKCVSVAVNPPKLPSEQLMQHALFYFHFYLRTMLFFGNYDPALTLMICEEGARRHQLSIPLPTISSFFNTCNENLKSQPASVQEKPLLVRLRDSYVQEVQTMHQMKTVVSFENMTHYFQESLNWFLICFIAYGLVADQAICHSCSGIIHYILGNSGSAKKSLGESIKCFECVFDRLHELDRSKISIVDRYVETYKLLSKVLIEQDQKKEALLVSERCRARALNEVLSLEYGMKEQVDQSVIELADIHSLVKTNKFAILIFSHCFKDLYTFVIRHAKELQLYIQSFGLHSMFELEQYIDQVFVKMKDTKDSNCGMFSFVEEILSMQGVELGSEASKEVDKIVQNALCEITNSDLSTANKQKPAGKESEVTSPLQMLYDKLLGKTPIDQEEIVIIPDGPLFRVPFAALWNSSTKRYLSQDKKIRLAPSLATLKLLSECPPDFHMLTGALVIGDPEVGKVMQDGVEKDIPSLESAQVEALVIASKFDVTSLTGPQATKPIVIEKLKQGASVVHIAAHGDLEKATILLAPTPEIRQVKTLPDEEDYMLTMADVQQAQVRAQLVVLSCCYSGRGEIRAEGVVGMCRAFLASGARSVVASLWDVNDDATLEFMSYFYLYLEEGKSASTSLQMAMNEVRQNERYSEPKYWAPFFLMGDDVTIKF